MPNVSRTERLTLKIIWLACFLIAVSVCAYMVNKTISEFLEFQVVTKIDTKNENYPEFPAILLCSMNPLMSKQAEKLIENYISNMASNLGYTFTGEFHGTPIEVSILNKAVELALLNISQSPNADKNNKNFLITNFFFNEKPYNSTNLETYFDVNMGVCVRFNTNPNYTERLMSTGRNNGLRLQIYMQKPENKYVSQFSYSEGLRLFVYNRSHDLFTKSASGVDVSIATSTIVAITRTFVNNEPFPYSDCIDLNGFNSVLYDYFKGKTYSQVDCFELCLQKRIIENCKCYDLRYPRLFDFSRSCDSDAYNCSTIIEKQFRANKIDSECRALCPLECSSVKYDLTVSTLSYPSVNTYNFYKDKLGNESYEEVKSKSVELNVYYSELGYTLITQTPKTSVIDLLSSIGGTLGLYIGISLLSFVEIVEALIEFLFIYFKINF